MFYKEKITIFIFSYKNITEDNLFYKLSNKFINILYIRKKHLRMIVLIEFFQVGLIKIVNLLINIIIIFIFIIMSINLS